MRLLLALASGWLLVAGMMLSAETRRVTIREDRSQTEMATKVYPLSHVTAGELAPFVEQAVKAMSPASTVRGGRTEAGEFLSVSMPVTAVAAVDAMLAALDRAPGGGAAASGIAGTGAVRGWHRPRHRSSEAMVEMLREVAAGRATVFRDPASGLIYWEGAASADADIRRALGEPVAAAPPETIHLTLGSTTPKLLSKVYILRHADPYEIRGLLREAVQATRISGLPTGVESLKYNDGTGAVIVTAEAYRFEKQSGGGLSIDELVAALDQPGASGGGGDDDETFMLVPGHRRADEVAAGLHEVGMVRRDDPRELDAGDSEVYVDPELNVMIVKAPPFDRQRIRDWAQVLDRPVPQIHLICVAYELHAESEERFGQDYQAWRQGPGVELLAAGVAAGEARRTTFLRFAPQWDTRFLDFLVSTGQATVMSRGEGIVGNRQEFRLGAMDCDTPGLHLRAIPHIAETTTTLEVQIMLVSDADQGLSGQSGRVVLPTHGGELLVGGLERTATTGEEVAASSWLGWLWGGSGHRATTRRVVLLIATGDSASAAPPPAETIMPAP